MKKFYFSTVLKRINGGPSDLALMLMKAHQLAPSNDTILKWKRTDLIPSKWVGAVIWACACHGIDPLELLTDEGETT